MVGSNKWASFLCWYILFFPNWMQISLMMLSQRQKVRIKLEECIIYHLCWKRRIWVTMNWKNCSNRDMVVVQIMLYMLMKIKIPKIMMIECISWALLRILLSGGSNAWYSIFLLCSLVINLHSFWISHMTWIANLWQVETSNCGIGSCQHSYIFIWIFSLTACCLQVGRERQLAFCLMQKFVDLRSLGTKLHMVSVFSLDHMKGHIYIEADRECDVIEVLSCSFCSNHHFIFILCYYMECDFTCYLCTLFKIIIF